MKQTITTLIFTLLAGWLVGCTADAAPAGILIEDAWGRPSPMSADNGAFYMELTNQTGTADALVGASTEACTMVELHDMKMADGVMKMEPVAGQRIPLPVGESVALAPGGLHVMCMGKTVDFVEGTEIELTLNFEQADPMQVTAVIGEP